MKSLSVPPRFVPTLTEEVEPGHFQETSSVQSLVRTPGQETEEAILQRVLHRVDQVFEKRLQEAVRQVILENTQTLALRLGEEIELAVRQSFSEAFQQEDSKT